MIYKKVYVKQYQHIDWWYVFQFAIVTYEMVYLCLWEQQNPAGSWYSVGGRQLWYNKPITAPRGV